VYYYYYYYYQKDERAKPGSLLINWCTPPLPFCLDFLLSLQSVLVLSITDQLLWYAGDILYSEPRAARWDMQKLLAVCLLTLCWQDSITDGLQAGIEMESLQAVGTMAQAVRRRPFIAKAWVRSQTTPGMGCGGQSGTGTGFCPNSSALSSTPQHLSSILIHSSPRLHRLSNCWRR